MKRILIVITSLALLAAGVTPAHAATSAPVTIVGHARDSAGKPLVGIRVSGGSDSSNHQKTFTSTTGRYVLRIRYVDSEIGLTFGDETHVHTNDTVTPFAVKPGHTYRVNRVLTVASEIAGTVTESNGTAVAGVFVHLYSATTGKRVSSYGSATSDSKGHFHLRARAGTYKVHFSYPENHSSGTWFGGTTLSAGTVVKVPEGAKVAHIDAIVKRT